MAAVITSSLALLAAAQVGATGSGIPAPPAAQPMAGAAAVVEAPQTAPVVGGFAPVNPRAPELRPVLKAAVAQLTPTPHARARLLSAERQVVAGTNYRLLLQLRDGSRWRVMVWQRLDGTRQVTEVLRAAL